MDKSEALFANNRAIICFFISMAGFLVMHSKMTDIHIRQVFCLSRKRNMGYVRKQGMVFSVCFAAVGIVLYEILTLVLGYAHITPTLAAFFLAGSAFVVFWMFRCMLVKDVGQVLLFLFFLIAMPFVIILVIIQCGVKFDRYLGVAAVVLALLAAAQYIGFVNGWRKEDLD